MEAEPNKKTCPECGTIYFQAEAVQECPVCRACKEIAKEKK
jgi:rubrerythrin